MQLNNYQHPQDKQLFYLNLFYKSIEKINSTRPVNKSPLNFRISKQTHLSTFHTQHIYIYIYCNQIITTQAPTAWLAQYTGHSTQPRRNKVVSCQPNSFFKVFWISYSYLACEITNPLFTSKSRKLVDVNQLSIPIW